MAEKNKQRRRQLPSKRHFPIRFNMLLLPSPSPSFSHSVCLCVFLFLEPFNKSCGCNKKNREDKPKKTGSPKNLLLCPCFLSAGAHAACPVLCPCPSPPSSRCSSDFWAAFFKWNYYIFMRNSHDACRKTMKCCDQAEPTQTQAYTHTHFYCICN